MQIQKCLDLHMDRQTLCFTVAIFLQYEKQYTFSKKLERNSPQLRETGGSRRRQ